LLVMTAAPVAAAVIAELIRHMLLCGAMYDGWLGAANACPGAWYSRPAG
jgi:hypothetical protein